MLTSPTLTLSAAAALGPPRTREHEEHTPNRQVARGTPSVHDTNDNSAKADDGHGGVRAVIERVYDRCAPSLYRFFLARTSSDEHLSRDLMQQLFLAALKTGREVSEHELEFWLRAVARRLLATHWRKAGVRARAHAEGSELSRDLAQRLSTSHLTPEVVANREAQRLLMLAITDLPSDDQTIILAHYFEGAPHAVIAERIGISTRAVEGRLYRARQAVRQRLAQLESL